MTPSVKQGSPRMFDSDFLERFSRAHPLTPALLYLPLVTLSLVLAHHHQKPIAIVGGVFAGYLLWTLTEYWLHRLVFHLPVVGPKTARAAFLIHGVHHDHPRDATRFVMPAGASLTLCGLTYLAFRAALGPITMWAPFAGFVLGYVIYDELHWYVHAGRPTSRFGRWLRRQHLLHHFKEPKSRFGVSCPWLDHAFGTASTDSNKP
jgi:sterol desaturase/sphingolipid hydroxylase (fatty acid hydroxylase superfamily)